MEKVTLTELDTGKLSRVRDIRHIVIEEVWPKIFRKAKSSVDEKYENSPKKRKAAHDSLKVLHGRSVQNAALLAKNKHHARTLQNQVESNKDILVVKAINEVYPRKIFDRKPWKRQSSKRKRGLMKPGGLNDLACLFEKLTPLLEDVKKSAEKSFFEHIPYICYIVVIVAIIKFPEAQTVGWWEDRENAILLASWAHKATEQSSSCTKIWSGIDLLFHAQHLVYCFFDKNVIMSTANDRVKRITDALESNSSDNSEGDPWYVAYYKCSEPGKVDRLIGMVTVIDPEKGGEMRTRYMDSSTESAANHSSQDYNTPFSGAFLDVRGDAAILWTTITDAVEKAKANKDLLRALRMQRQARGKLDKDESKTASVQAMADHVAEGLRFGLLLHNCAELIEQKVNIDDGVSILLDRIDKEGELRIE